MKRRNAVLALLQATLPLAALGQQRRPYRIGYLVQSPLTEPPSAERAAFLDELGKLGYLLGKNLLIEYRSAENTLEFLPDLAQELVKLGVDLIFAAGGVAATAAQAVTSRIPVVFAHHPDPVGSGLVKSLAKPGGNITGISSLSTELAGKRLQLLREILPSAKYVVMLSGSDGRTMADEVDVSRRSAKALGLALEPFAIENAEALVQRFEQMGRRRPDAVMVRADPKMLAYRDILVEQAGRLRLPLFAGFAELVRAGALVSYSADFSALFRRSAHLVDKVLRGAKPSDLPVEQPTHFTMLLNMKVAKSLGLKIPQGILLRANEVIE